jgi:hypothetical protein
MEVDEVREDGTNVVDSRACWEDLVPLTDQEFQQSKRHVAPCRMH